jgi:hypothetical protein
VIWWVPNGLCRAGYLACARCSGSGTLISMESTASAGGELKTLKKTTNTKCSSCAGAAKVWKTDIESLVWPLVESYILDDR